MGTKRAFLSLGITEVDKVGGVLLDRTLIDGKIISPGAAVFLYKFPMQKKMPLSQEY